ncbi:hypothetical protein ACIQY5_20040 [Peribacillus frigoritolerans]|jgi:hypothetical protein|uniref:hypothetical protein n=1 Tax=Peribacillus frigoritolerans TaxID=450367 RepID=UPI003808BB59
MNYKVIINMPISNHEIPELRELVGWGRRDKDFPILFKRCNFWAGVRNKNNKLIAFGYVRTRAGTLSPGQLGRVAGPPVRKR